MVYFWKYLRGLVRWATRALMLVLVIVFGLLAYFQTPAGQNSIGQFIASQMTSGNTRVKIAATTGSPPGRMRFIGLSVADNQGVWAKADSLEIAIQPLALLSGLLDIQIIRLRNVQVIRQPEGADKPSSTEPFRLPELPVSINIQAFRVDNLNLSEEVAGVAANLNMTGAAEWRGTDIGLDLDIRRTDTDSDKIVARLNLDQGESLAVDMSIKGAPGGLMASLAGLQAHQGIMVSLSGDGPLDGWSGDLQASVDGLASFGGDVTVAEKPDYIAIGVKGDADIKDIIPEDVAARLGSNPALALEARLAAGEPLGLKIEMQNAALFARLETSYLSDSISELARFELNIQDPAILQPWLGSFSLAAGYAKGVVTGNMARPEISVKAQISGLAVNNEPLEGFDTVDLLLKGVRESDPDRFHIKELVANTPAFSAEGGGSFSLGGEGGELLLEVVAPDLKKLRTLSGMTLDGSVNIRALLQLEKTGDQNLDLVARTKDFQTGIGQADGMLGPAPVLKLKAVRSNEATTTKASLEVEGKAVMAVADGALDQGNQIQGEYKVGVTDTPVMREVLGLNLPADIALAGAVSGPIDDPLISGRLTASDMTEAQLALRDIGGDFQFKNIVTSPAGKVNFSMTLPAGQMKASAVVASRADGTIVIDPISVTAPQTVITGNLLLPPKEGLTGNLTGEVANLEQLAAQFDLEAGGTARFDVQMKSQGKDTHIAAHAGIDSFSTILPGRDVARIEKLEFSASAIMGQTLRDVTAELNISSMRAVTAEISELALSLSGEGRATHYKLSLAGDYRGDVSFESEGDFTDNRDGFTLIVSRANGILYGRDLKLNKLLNIRAGKGKLIAAPLDMDFADGQITGRYIHAPGKMDVEAAVNNLDLILVSLVLPQMPVNGKGDASVQLTLTDGVPNGSVDISLRDVVSASGQSSTVPPAQVTLVGNIDGSSMAFDGHLTAEDILVANVRGSVPLKIDNTAGTMVPDRKRPVAASLDWKGEVGIITALVPTQDHRISGNLNGKIQVSGTLEAPAFAGDARLADGYYENLSLGLLANNASAEMTLDNRRVMLKAFQAGDGEGGQFSGEGFLDLLPDQQFPADIRLTLGNARVLRTNDIKAAASAALGYRRSPENATLDGSLEVKSLDAKIKNRLPPDIVKIEVTEINLPPGRETAAVNVSDRQSGVDYPTLLDVRVEAARRLFVRGKGLDSEWGGQLDIGGTVEEPTIAGEMELVRGTFTTAGKEFNLTEGTLTFVSGGEIDPIINVQAEYKTGSFTAILRLTGRASQPDVMLSSSPELPQDEILARILFGTSADKLGALEAAQLASAAASFSGSGDGLDVLDVTRSALGLDRLRVESGAGDGTDRSAGALIAGGKYLTNNIYIEVETAPSTGQSKASVKVDLTDNLSVESDVGSDNTTGISLQWRKDY